MTATTTARALALIDRHNGTVGAFVDVMHDRAMSEANESAAVDPGSAGPLQGVPIGVKELFDVAGADGSYGSDVLAGRRGERDAAVVSALRRAGAIIVGTTRSHEFGWGITTQHPTRGSTANPWALDRVAGGSSGGSAAAVACGMVPLAIGSDTGGSIRLPAAFCGVLGLKTTFGRVSRAGGVPLAPSFDSPGFLARSVKLLAAAFYATASRDTADSATAQSPVPSDLVGPAAISRLRFAVPTGLSPLPIEQARADAMESLLDGLRRIGMQQIDVDVPNGSELFAAFAPIQMAEALDVHTNILHLYPDASARYGADVRSRLELAEHVSMQTYLAARRTQHAAIASFARAFQIADVLVSPVGPTAPSFRATPDVVSLAGDDMTLRDAMMPYTVPQNLAGLPSITVPVGLDDAGMPIGIQLTGAPWSEPMLLSLARSLEAGRVLSVATPQSFSGS